MKFLRGVLDHTDLILVIDKVSKNQLAYPIDAIMLVGNVDDESSKALEPFLATQQEPINDTEIGTI